MGLDPIKWISGWHLGRGIAKLFHNFKEGLLKTAVSVTEVIKTTLDGGFVQSLASFIDGALNTHLATDALKLANVVILKALAVELAIDGLPDNPTEQDILDFETRVITAVTGLTPSATSKLWTTVAAAAFEHFKEALGNDDVLTFAEIVNAVEETYQDYLKAKADEQASL